MQVRPWVRHSRPRLNLNVDLEKFAMKLHTCFYAALPAALLASTLILGGCAGMTQQEKSTATGAVIGGVVGNVLCGGVACTAAGAAVGGVIGHEIKK
jgi:osmotically inducible lipoprotein OsmB